jgi:hypothetical protein
MESDKGRTENAGPIACKREESEKLVQLAVFERERERDRERERETEKERVCVCFGWKEI